MRRSRQVPLGDPFLFFLVVGLACFGIAMVFSAGVLDVPSSVVRGLWGQQTLWFCIGMLALPFILRIPVIWLEWAAQPIYATAIVLLVLTLAFGTGAGTAASVSGWLAIGPVRIQPSEFAKIAVILMLARVLGSWREAPRTLWALWKPIGVVMLPMALVMLQPDLGTGLVFGSIMFAMLFWAGTPLPTIFFLASPVIGLFLSINPWVWGAYVVILGLAMAFLYKPYLSEGVTIMLANIVAGTIALPLWNSLETYQKNRFLVFLDPNIDARGAGYNLIQSRVAIGSGGLFGKGFLEGTQKSLAFLPEQHTDFIFAVIGEEWGFLGVSAVLIAFGLIFWRLVRIAERSSDPFASLVPFGLFGSWFAHVLVNTGMTVGIMPITGIPLPFLSYGGSFLLVNILAMALIQRIAAEAGDRVAMAWFKKPKTRLQATDKRELPGEVWDKCPACGEILYREKLRDNWYVCPQCAFHNRLPAAEYVNLLLDPDTAEEHDAELRSGDPLGFVDLKPYRERLAAAERKTGQGDALIAASGQLASIPVQLAVMNFEFIGGSMGSVVGEKIARAGLRALDAVEPFIVVSASGGARMMEGIFSLMQMAKTSAVLAQLHEAGLPYISVLTDPTTGGVTASFAMLGDANLAEPGALIGFAGPRVIQQTIKQELPEGFQTSEFLLEHGMLDDIIDRRQLKAEIARLLRHMLGLPTPELTNGGPP